MKVIQAQSSQYGIEYPEVASEFEVHAALYSELKVRGLDVRGEVKARGCFGLRQAKTGCRFDLVVFVRKRAVAILEVKSGPVCHRTSVEDTRQGVRYPHFGVPVVLVYGMEQVQGAVAAVQEIAGGLEVL